MMTTRVNALEHFIKDITDYSRNNRTEVAIVNFNLHQLATEIWDSLKYCQKAEHIHFEMDFDQDMMLESDPHRLRIILSNLISNAIRYHDSRKENRYIRLSCKRTEKSFVLDVEDNGQGIAPEYHNSIFQMFFRANESSTGSGLGLYIVNEAIDKLSGQLLLQSAVAQGSTFTVKIPTA
jgi:signal transduction histidine kinase